MLSMVLLFYMNTGCDVIMSEAFRLMIAHALCYTTFLFIWIKAMNVKEPRMPTL